jgi:hypothetical protein
MHSFGRQHVFRLLSLVGLAAVALLLPSCSWDGHINILGYSTRPNYGNNIKTVKVNIIQNPTLWRVVPVVGLEEQLTWAIVQKIEQVTPWKVVQDGADTELDGIVRSFTLANTVYSQINERREGEATLVVELRWRDRRTGEILSKPSTRAVGGVTSTPPLLPGQSNPLALAAGLPDAQTPITTPDSPLSNSSPATFAQGAVNQPIGTAGAVTGEEKDTIPFGAPGALPGAMVRAVAYFRPELGQSLTSAQQNAVTNMATQIVSLMECGW